MTRVKTKMVNVAIYPAIVIATTSPKEFKRIRAKYTEKPCLNLDHADGITYTDHKGHWIVGVFNGSLGTLVHELAHVTFRILRHVGIPANHKHQEAFAYLQEWLFDELHGVVS